MHYDARYYDPRLGWFVSEDPIGFAALDTNLYRYTGNNPINYVDPMGLEETCPKCGGTGWYTKTSQIPLVTLGGMDQVGYQTVTHEVRCCYVETKLVPDDFVSRYGLYLNTHEKTILNHGCVGVTAISIREFTRAPLPDMNLARVLHDEAKYFLSYKDAKLYYDNLRRLGDSPALFGICQDKAPLSVEGLRDRIQTRKETGTNHYFDVSILSLPLTISTKGEISWPYVECLNPFDYVLLANIDTGWGAKPQWLHATGGNSNGKMKVIVTPVNKWSESRHVIWAVVKERGNIWKKYDLTFDIPDRPWKERAPEWSIEDYTDNNTPPFVID